MGSQREKMQKKRNVGVSCSNSVSRIINTGLEDECHPSSRTMYSVHEAPKPHALSTLVQWEVTVMIAIFQTFTDHTPSSETKSQRCIHWTGNKAYFGLISSDQQA